MILQVTFVLVLCIYLPWQPTLKYAQHLPPVTNALLGHLGVVWVSFLQSLTSFKKRWDHIIGQGRKRLKIFEFFQLADIACNGSSYDFLLFLWSWDVLECWSNILFNTRQHILPAKDGKWNTRFSHSSLIAAPLATWIFGNNLTLGWARYKKQRFFDEVGSQSIWILRVSTYSSTTSSD